MTKRYAIIAFCIVALALFFGLHFAAVGANQGGTAHGEQGANLAMAEGFIGNGFDFFQPKTRALNYQNGDYNLYEAHPSGITAAHFPIHSFLPALVHSITDRQLSKVVQFYNILWGFVGLFFLYLLSLRITHHIGKSIFIAVFIGTAPIFAFYQSNFLPEIPALTCVIIGTYFLHRFLQNKQLSKAYYALAWMLLGCLTSPDLILFMIGAAILIVNQAEFRGNPSIRKVIPITVFFLPAIFSLLYFYYQKDQYGSQFGGLLQDWEYDQSIRNSIIHSWKLHYFTVFQTVVGAIVLILLAVQIVKKKVVIDWKNDSFLRFTLFTVIAVGVAVLNPYQSFYSDVYFLKMLLLPFTLLVIFVVNQLDINWMYRYPKMAVGGFVVLLFVMLGEGNWTQHVRHELNRTSPGSNLAFTFRGGDELLKKHGVKASDQLSVVFPLNWGIGQEALSHLRHTGTIREMPNGEELLPRFPKGHYVVCHIDERPYLFNRFQTKFEELGDNGSIVLYKAID